MDIPLQLTFRDVPHSTALEQRITRSALKLSAIDAGITTCRITVERRHRHQRHGRQYNVRIDLHLPDHDIVVNHEHDEDLDIALHDAFDAALRQLKARRAR